MKKITVITIIVLLPILSAAQSRFNVEYNKIEGALTSQDMYKRDFGRYDGYNLPMKKGERAYFLIYSNDFPPNLVLVTPDDQIYKQVSSKGDDFVATGIEVPVEGEWVLYVLGDSTARGNYFLQIGFTDSASLTLDRNADFCTGLNYLLAHSKAYFIFPQSIPTNEPLYKLKDAEDFFISGDDASYNATFYQGNSFPKAESTFNSVVQRIKNCLPDDMWKISGTEWRDVESWKEKHIVWNESVKGNRRTIELIFTDLSYATDADYPNDYSVELTISKK